MTDHDPIPEAEDSTPPPTEVGQESPGRRLRHARERRGMAFDEVARQTRLAPHIVEAMENDDFAAIGEPVYARGYYRKVARLVGLDEAEIIAQYELTVTPARARPRPRVPTRPLVAAGGELGKSRGRGGRMWWWILLLLLIIVGVLLWLAQRSSAPLPEVFESVAPASSAASAASTPTPQAAGGPAPAVAVLGGAASSPAPAASALPAAPASASAPAAAATAAETAAEPAATVPKDALVLKFDENSWVRVRDASGKTLLTGLVSSGEKRTVDGRPPYQVFLGNAPGVQLRYRGKRVPVGKYTRSNAVAKFSVP